MAPARLAVWPIEQSLRGFYHAVAEATFQKQCELYFEARAYYSHDAILDLPAGHLLEGSSVPIVKTKEGWLLRHTSYLFGSGSVPDFTPEQFFAYAERLWQAKEAYGSDYRYATQQVRDRFAAAARERPAPPPEAGGASEERVYMIVENMPQMIPNDAEGMKKLQQCIVYPELAKKADVEGRVFVQFVVDEQGNVVDPVVQRGIGADADQEALRCVQQLKFHPGRQGGRAVRVKMSLPVTFPPKR